MPHRPIPYHTVLHNAVLHLTMPYHTPPTGPVLFSPARPIHVRPGLACRGRASSDLMRSSLDCIGSCLVWSGLSGPVHSDPAWSSLDQPGPVTPNLFPSARLRVVSLRAALLCSAPLCVALCCSVLFCSVQDWSGLVCAQSVRSLVCSQSGR
eukprot:gene3619-biopygen20265